MALELLLERLFIKRLHSAVTSMTSKSFSAHLFVLVGAFMQHSMTETWK